MQHRVSGNLSRNAFQGSRPYLRNTLRRKTLWKVLPLSARVVGATMAPIGTMGMPVETAVGSVGMAVGAAEFRGGREGRRGPCGHKTSQKKTPPSPIDPPALIISWDFFLRISVVLNSL